MPGFVDVSNMNSYDVKRLGHMDDPTTYRNPYAYRKPRPATPKFSYEADKVWGAAVVAFRINGAYVKALIPGLPAQKTNRQIVDEILINDTHINDVDLEEGRKMRLYFKGLTFKIIEGKALSPFLKSTMEIAGKDNITDNLGVATIASLPATYEKMVSRDDTDRKIKWANGGYIGVVGNKTKQDIEIIKQIWSDKWNTHYITGINNDNQVLFFAYKGVLKIGDRVTIEGKIKGHRDNSTQLSHVKVIK
jgi:hypothetical protein